MKKRIYRSICLTAMAAVLAAMLLAICFFSGQYTAILQAEKLGQYVGYGICDPRLSALMEVLKREYCGD